MGLVCRAGRRSHRRRSVQGLARQRARAVAAAVSAFYEPRPLRPTAAHDYPTRNGSLLLYSALTAAVVLVGIRTATRSGPGADSRDCPIAEEPRRPRHMPERPTYCRLRARPILVGRDRHPQFHLPVDQLFSYRVHLAGIPGASTPLRRRPGVGSLPTSSKPGPATVGACPGRWSSSLAVATPGFISCTPPCIRGCNAPALPPWT